MERLARELMWLAWELERDARDIRNWANTSNESVASGEPVDSAALSRIEQTLGDVHRHTTTLIQRVPDNLKVVLEDLKQMLLQRLGEAVRSTESDEPSWPVEDSSASVSTETAQSPAAVARLLTPQERKVFQMCFQSGLLSYRDIASQLDITPTAAKNLVNRIFLSDRKRALFAKEYRHGAVRLALRPDVQGRILAGTGSDRECRKRTSVPRPADE
jgi:DNA-binding CsgD family transcriptional regulator